MRRVRWFYGEGQGDVVFDIRPDEASVGWYRFDVPVGTTTFSVPVRCDTRVWIDGTEQSVTDRRVELKASCDAPTLVAVRIEQVAAMYVGTAWIAPVAVETVPITVDAGDWSALGLDSYSGRACYLRTVMLPKFDEADRAVLKLGDVVAAASVSLNDVDVSKTFTRPFRLDVSDTA